MAAREETNPFDPYDDVFGLSSTDSASSAPAQSLESSGSPFSPLGHVASTSSAVDVFATAASGSEGILLSFSPLAQSTGPSSTSGSDRFSSFQGLSSSSIEAPPVQPQRPASFSETSVSEGQLLSFSPVATLPPAPSFFASSTGRSTASGSSAFGNDDLFSLSMDLSMSATSVASIASSTAQEAESVSASDTMDLTQTPPSAFGFMESASSSQSSSASAAAFGAAASDSTLPDVFAHSLNLSAKETSDSRSLSGSFVSAEPLHHVDIPSLIAVEAETEAKTSDELLEALPEIDLLQTGSFLSDPDEKTIKATAEAVEVLEAASVQEICSSQASDSDSAVDKHHEEQLEAFDSFVADPEDVELEKSTDSFAFDGQETNISIIKDPLVAGDGNDVFSFTTKEPILSSEEESHVENIDGSSAQIDNDDGFGDFGGSTGNQIEIAPVVARDIALGDSSTSSAFDAMESDGFGDFAQESSPATQVSGFGDENDYDFGDFAQSSNDAAGFDDDDVAFGDFAQSSGAAEANDEDDGFGDFLSGSFQASSTNDDGFGDFASPPQAPELPPSVVPRSLNIPIASKQDVAAFFTQAFAASSSTTGKQLLDSAGSGIPANSVQIFQEQLGSVNDTLERVFISELDSYCATSCSNQSSSAAAESTEDPTESKPLSLKYLKYVLTAKIQEATRYNGIFPDGSEKHQHFESIANSGNEDAIRAAVAQLQEELFHSSVNDAMMRLAKQAALSAKAKIAEQAALQQANSRTSILTTTRNLLSRGGGASERDVSSSNASGSTAPSSTGASNKSSRSSGHEDSLGGSGDETGSDGTGEHHSGHSSDPETHTGIASAPRSSGSGGLMKKFQDRFSPFSSSRSKPRTVSLRRMGESGEEVRTMELNMDSINGGFDEVKWKCAVFLYDMEEVAHVAPSQIQILSYPGKQVLSGKSDRSALVKFLKPGTIWSIDIGANNSDVLNEW